MKAKIVIAATLAVASLPAHALNVKNYRSMEENARAKSGWEGGMYESSLTTYFQGVADTLNLQRPNDHGAIVVTEGVYVCIPPKVKLTSALVKSAVRQEIDDNKDIYAKANPAWEETVLTFFAATGLARMFPCEVPGKSEPAIGK